jgi:hypothetical protein
MPFTVSSPGNNGPGGPVMSKGASKTSTQPRPSQVTGPASVHRAAAAVEASQNKGETLGD